MSQLRIFISYAREDSPFVDRLEADLIARDFYVWVDRRQLEGGEIWAEKIQEAIDTSDLIVLVVSPDALASKFVRSETNYALGNEMTVIPLIHRDVEKVWLEISSLQWVNAQNYNEGLERLFKALTNELARRDSAPPPPTPRPERLTLEQVTEQDWDAPLVKPVPAAPVPDRALTELYQLGFAAYSQKNLDLTVAYWDQLNQREPNFQNGYVRSRLREVNEELKVVRVGRLRKRADEAHARAKWGQEIGAWDALLAIMPNDRAAKEARTIAERNLNHEWLYDMARDFLAAGNFDAARTQLKELWKTAPYFGDPEGFAKRLDLESAANRVEVAKQAVAKKEQEQLALERQKQAQLEQARREQAKRDALFKPFPLLMARILWWVCLNPAQLISARDERFERVRGASAFLLSLVAWLPLVLPLLATTIGSAQYVEGIEPQVAFVIVLIGMLLMPFAKHDDPYEITVGMGEIFIGILILIASGICAYVLANAVMYSTSHHVPLLAAYIVGSTAALGVVVGIGSVIGGMRVAMFAYFAILGLLLGMPFSVTEKIDNSFAILALFVVLPVIIIVPLFLVLPFRRAFKEEEANNTTRLAFFALAAFYVFIIWFSFLGGQSVLGGNIEVHPTF